MVARISDDYEPQFPVVVGEDLPCPAARDVVASRVGAVWPLETVNQRSRVVGNSFRLPCSDSDDSDDEVLSVGAVRPLTTAAQLGGASRMDDCRLHADSKDDVLSVGAWAPKNRHVICCARLDDFDWVVAPYEPDMVLPEREMDIGIPDVGRDICILPDKFPVVVVRTAVEPLFSPVVFETGPQVGHVPDLYLSTRNGEVDIVHTRWDIRNLPDVSPVMFDKTAAGPMTLPVDVELDSQVGEDPDVVWTGRDMDMGDPDVDRNIQVLMDVGQMMIDESATGPLSLPVVFNMKTQVDVSWEVRPLWRWFPSLLGVAVLRDGSILNLTVA